MTRGARIRATLRFASGLWIASGLWTGLGGAPAIAATPPALVVAVSRTPFSLPVYVADAEGYFRADGVDVQVLECIGGQRCVEQMLDGRAHVATSSELPVVFNAFARNDFAVFATFASSTRDVKIVARRGDAIGRAADLDGRVVGVPTATSAHYFLDSALLFAGVDPRRVRRLPLPPEDMAAALAKRRIDAAVVWEPYAQDALRALGGRGLELADPRIYDATFNLVARRDALERHAAEIGRFLGALERANRFIAGNPDAAKRVLERRLAVDRAYVDAIWGNYRYALRLGHSLLATMEGQVRWAVRERYAPEGTRPPSMLDFVEAGPLRRALPDAVTLVR